MTRVTAPMSKLARSLTSHPSVARSTYLAGAHTYHQNAAPGVAWAELSERDDNNRHFTTTHRPTPNPTPSRNRTVPLMQTFNFRTSTPKAAQLDTSTIDYAVMPSLAADNAAAKEASLMALRVPLLPDNFFPQRELLDGHGPEETDGPLAGPQIVVVAAHPDLVTPASALTEIEGIGIDGVELSFAHDTDAAGATASSSESGMIRDLWKGLIEDLTSSPTTTTKNT